MRSAHRVDNSWAELGKVQIMVVAKRRTFKHLQPFTALTFISAKIKRLRKDS